MYYCQFVLLHLLMFVLCVGVLLYRVYRYVQLLCLPLGLIQEEMEIMNNPITSNKIKALIKNLWKTKTQETESFTGELNQTFTEELMSTVWNLFQKFQGSNTSRLITQGAITLIPKPEKDKATKGRIKKRKKERKGKLQANNTAEHGWKSPEQSFSKQNSAAQQKSHTPWSSWVYSRDARIC